MSTPAYTLPAIPHLRLRATLRAGEPARLPPFKGSALRGAFGHALRSAVCAFGPDHPCRTCTLRAACAYTRLFETFVEGDPPPFLEGLTTAPRPYVFEPLEGSAEPAATSPRTDFAPGDPLRTDLLLFGQAVELQAYALLALERMAENGLGARRHPFRLERVDYLAQPDDGPPAWTTGYEAGGRRWPGTVPPLPADLGRPHLPSASAPTRLTLRFATPTRIKVNGRLASDLTFRRLAFQMLRRTLELAHFHVPGAEPDWTFKPYLQAASDIQITRSALRWHEQERYSSRQRRKHPFGGLVGELDLEGPLAPFLPLLRTAETVHVGKGTPFGLGKIEIV